MSILQIKYNRVICSLSVIVPIVFIIIICIVIPVDNWLFFCLPLGLLFLFILFKFFIPMLNEKPALELNSDGIYDHIRGHHATWNDIIEFKKIQIIKGEEAFRIGVMLTQKKKFMKGVPIINKPFCWLNLLFYSTPFVIHLGPLSGANEEILKKMLDYHHQIKSDS